MRCTRSRFAWPIAPGLGSPCAAATGEGTVRPLALEPLPAGSIRPSGWLKVRLRTQADGLGGSLDEYRPDIKESAWMGGEAEGRGLERGAAAWPPEVLRLTPNGCTDLRVSEFPTLRD
jgi:hypothetical protein